MQKKRVLIVDDSLFMRRMLSDLIMEHPGFEVAGTAKDGSEAAQMVSALKPDVITMDVEMPVMNGIEALKVIMKESPTPVIMLSRLTLDGAEETFQALESGAVDFVCKPSIPLSFDLPQLKQSLHEKLEIAVQSRIGKERKAGMANARPPTPEAAQQELSTARSETAAALEVLKQTGFQDIVAIGTSTGGPKALQQVLAGIPANFPAPIVIVQHMPAGFTRSLAQRLDTASKIRVMEGSDGMVLEKGTAYIAPGGYHMTVHKEARGSYWLRTSQEEQRGGHRPSVEVLFESLLPLKELRRHIVLMTGMGRDGASSMQALKNSGAETTIAESEESCIVYGMPRAAVELGCVDYVIPVYEITEKLTQVMTQTKGR